MSIRTAILFVSLAYLITACGSRPYFTELQTLVDNSESLVSMNIQEPFDEIEDPNILELREAALDNYESALVFRDRAIDAHDEHKDDNAELLTRIGLLYYAAAENYYRSAEARGSLREANQRFEVQRQRRNDYRDQLESEQETITLLLAVQNLLDENEELRRQLATIEDQNRADNRANNAIQEARILQREAEFMNGERYAEDDYDEGMTRLSAAIALYEDGEQDEAFQTALEAVEAFQDAIEASEGEFMEDQDRLLRDEQNEEIYEMAQDEFGRENAFVDSRGIVVVIPAAFDREDTDIESDAYDQLDIVVEMLEEFENREILIEGHTRESGSSADNMALSATRAENVRDYFLDQSISRGRLDTAGFGEEAPRFNSSDDNDRVEIIFLAD